MGIHIIQKIEGETMNQVIERAKSILILQGIEVNNICYAGRLDPLASGGLIILTNTDVFYKMNYCNLIKTYTFSIIRGFQTDTYDILGLATISPITSDVITAPHEYLLQYPPYSGYCIKGKPYWKYTRENEKPPFVPYKKTIVYRFKSLDVSSITGDNLFKLIRKKISKITQGDFRQVEIINKWQDIINSNNEYTLEHYEVMISSGGYVRTLANLMGATAFNIRRMQYKIIQ